MGDVVDITELLKNRKWPTEIEKSHVVRHLRTSELTVIVSESINRILESAASSLPLEQSLPVYSLSRLTRAVLQLIKEINAEIKSAPRLEEAARVKILIAEAMFKDVETLFNQLSEKMGTYQLDEV